MAKADVVSDGSERTAHVSAPGFRPIVKAFDALIEQPVQCDNTLRSESKVEFQLRLLPGNLPFGTLCSPCFGDLNKAAARIGPGTGFHPALTHERLHVARQGRRIHLHALGQIARADRTQPRDVGQQRVLRVLQARRRDMAVVVTRHDAIELTKF